MSVVLLCLGVWVLLTPSRSRVARRRAQVIAWNARDAASVLAGIATLIVVGGMWGVLLGLAVALLARRVLARMASDEPRRRDQMLRMAPDAVECLAACVAAGAPLWPAMNAVADSFGGPAGDLLRRSAARHRLGAPHDETFDELLRDPVMAPVGRVMMRSVESGASLSVALTTCAEQMRQVRGSELENRARAVGVKAVAPLAGCFLPAFIVLAVVPIIGSLVTGLF